jgi:hypothetical protein
VRRTSGFDDGLRGGASFSRDAQYRRPPAVNDLPLQKAVELFPLARHSDTRSDHTAVVSSMHGSLLRPDHEIDTGLVQRILASRHL